MKKNFYKKYFLITSFIIFILDQVTKIQIAKNFKFAEVLEVVPGFFNLTLGFNKGIAFGLLSDLSETMRIAILVVLTTIALFLLGAALIKEYKGMFYSQMALAFIFGGALGNILDRIRLGYVIDFLDVYYKNFHWPAFNVADSAICVGVCFLLGHMIFGQGQRKI